MENYLVLRLKLFSEFYECELLNEEICLIASHTPRGLHVSPLLLNPKLI